MDDRTGERLSEREQQLPEHETREKRDINGSPEVAQTGGRTPDIDDVAVDTDDGPPPVTRSG